MVGGQNDLADILVTDYQLKVAGATRHVVNG
jgi:hypothetical protein